MKTSSYLVLASIALSAACSSSKDGSGEPAVSDLPATPTAPASSDGPSGVGSGAAPDMTLPKTEDGGAPAEAGAASDGGAGPAVDGKCCVNGLCFVCPDKAALDKCIGFDLDGCLAACAKDDAQCILDCVDKLDGTTPDPSGCKAEP